MFGLLLAFGHGSSPWVDSRWGSSARAGRVSRKTERPELVKPQRAARAREQAHARHSARATRARARRSSRRTTDSRRKAAVLHALEFQRQHRNERTRRRARGIGKFHDSVRDITRRSGRLAPPKSCRTRKPSPRRGKSPTRESPWPEENRRSAKLNSRTQAAAHAARVVPMESRANRSPAPARPEYPRAPAKEIRISCRLPEGRVTRGCQRTLASRPRAPRPSPSSFHGVHPMSPRFNLFRSALIAIAAFTAADRATA